MSAAGMQKVRASIHAGINAVVLRVVEDIEILPAEIECASFAEREALENAHVKVDAAGTGKCVAADIAEGQSSRYGKGVRVVQKRATNAGDIRRVRAVGISDEVGTRSCADAVGDTSRIAEVRAVGNANRRTSLCDGDTGDLPSAEKRVRKARSLEERQGIDIADSQVMANVEVRAATIRG